MITQRTSAILHVQRMQYVTLALLTDTALRSHPRDDRMWSSIYLAAIVETLIRVNTQVIPQDIGLSQRLDEPSWRKFCVLTTI